MSITGYIAKRIYGTRRMPASLIVMRAIAIIGIAVGTATLLSALSIIKGFENEYQKAILNFNAHVVVLKAGEMTDTTEVQNFLNTLRETDKEFARRVMPITGVLKSFLHIYQRAKDLHDDVSYEIENYPGLLSLWERVYPERMFESLPERWRNFLLKIADAQKHGVTGVTPFLYREGLAISNGIIKGIVVKGIDPRTVRDVNQMRIDIPAGANLNDALQANDKEPSIILGSALARQFGIKEGETNRKIKLMVPKTGSSKLYFTAKMAGTFESGLYDYDSHFALMSIDNVAKIFETGAVTATGIEIKLDDPAKADIIAAALDEKLMSPYQAMTWSELNEDLFEAISLEKFVFSIIMGILVVVAAFNIIAVLVLLIYHRTHEIAILKALGLKNSILQRVFTRGGISTGIIGTTAGIIIGTAVSMAVKEFHLIRLEPEVYFISTLPIDISWSICGMIAFFSVLMCVVTSRIASKRLSDLNISESLRT